MDHSQFPNFDSSFYHQQGSASNSPMYSHRRISPDFYASEQTRNDVGGGANSSSSSAGMHYGPSSSSTALGMMPRVTDSAPGYSYGHEPYGYNNAQQFSQSLENNAVPPSTAVANGHMGYSMDAQNCDPFGSPESGTSADFEESFMMMENGDTADSPPDCSFTAPQLTSPANQRAATARRKRAAKYICDMCGSKLTAKHNLTSKSSKIMSTKRSY
jgi:hypothetical protein